MKVTSVELHPDGSSDVFVLSFRDPSRLNPYNVKGITGLDADELVARFYGAPGAQNFYNMMLVKRQPMMLIELNPRYNLGESPATLRDAMYRMIASSRRGKVDIWFKNGEEVVAVLSGNVIKLEAPNFTTRSEVQITFNCVDPFLKAPTPVSLSVVALDPSLTEIQDDLSTAPHGVVFELTATAPITSITIDDPDDLSWEYTITPVGGFVAGDVIHYSSQYNDKYIYLVRAGVTIHLADVLTPGSIWPIIFPGRINTFRFSNGPSLDWNTISYYPTYWGV